MTTAIGISACVVTFNEQDRIGDCLASLAFCDEWIVVDCHSTDRTREIAASLGARVIERDWPGFQEQKEFAVAAATHDWVLCLDADERVSPRLRDEIGALVREGRLTTRAGWRFPRKTHYLGRFIDHGGWYPDRQLRLYDRRRGRWAGREPHPKVVIDGEVGELRGDLFHFGYRDLAHHLRTIDSYTTTMARGLAERGKRASALDLVVRPAFSFLRNYVLKRGFLDGWRGLLIAYLGAHYVRLKYAKLLIAQRADDREGRVASGTDSARAGRDRLP